MYSSPRTCTIRIFVLHLLRVSLGLGVLVSTPLEVEQTTIAFWAGK